MTLLLQRIDDFIEAHEVSDKGQVLTMACLIGVSESSGHDVTKFRDVAHVGALDSRVQRESPARRSVRLLLRTKNADKVLIVERRNDERMIRKPGFSHYPVDFSFPSEVGNVQLSFADCFGVRQRGPDEVLDAGILGGAYCSGCLLKF